MAYTYNDFLKKATDNGTLSSFTPDELSLAKAYPEYGISAASLKQDQNTATTSAQRALANEAAAQLAVSYQGLSGSTGVMRPTDLLKSFHPDMISIDDPVPKYSTMSTSYQAAPSSRSTLDNEAAAQLAASYKTTSYNGFTGSKQDEIDKILGEIGSFPDFSWDQEAPTYDNKYEEEQDSILDQIGKYPDFSWDQEAPTYTNPYEQLQQELLDKVLNREDFTWSKDTDPVFGEYQKQYLREGERATANALAQAAAASGGQTSSYAATAAAQAGNYYAAQLSDKIPELYNQAYQRYLSEYEMMANDLGLVNSQQQLDYKEYLDQLDQYNQDKEFAYQQYLNDYNMLLSYLDAVNGQEQMDYQEYLDKLGQYNGDKEFAYQQYLDNYNKLQSYLGNLQDVNNDEYQKYLDEQEQKRYEQEQQQALQKQKQEMAQAQVDAILQAGGTPSSALVSQSGYSQEYINSMVNYYRQQAAKAAASYRSYSSGSSGSKSSSSSSSSSKNNHGSSGNLVYVPQYGEISYDDVYILQKKGLVRVDGYKNGKPVVTPLKNNNYSGFTQLTR